MRYQQDQNLAPKCCELCPVYYRNKTPTQTTPGENIDTEHTHILIRDIHFIRFFGASIKR